MFTKKVKTKSINAAIKKFAAENKLSESKIRFNINGVETYIKTTSDNEFKLYKGDPLSYYNNSEKIINQHVRFKQLYIITIFIENNSESAIDLKYDIQYSDNYTKPYIIIDPDSYIPYNFLKPKETYLLLLKELNNIKAKNKILINIFDDQMIEKLKIFTKFLYKNNFSKKVKLPLFSGIEPEVSVGGKLIKHYLNKKTDAQVIEVDVGELLVEYTKPIFGKNGLNAFGDIVEKEYVHNNPDIEAKVDDLTIEVIEDNKKKIYKSKIKGFVVLDKNIFCISNKLKMDHLSRVESSVDKDEANNIEVIISQHDSSIDSVGEGVELTSETIHITGHVGAKSILKAVNLNIEGATHQDSLQESKYAEINRHKGKLRCHSAKINLLEGGEVHATNVEIDSSIGGSVYAENVTIGSVKSFLKVYASNSITVKLVTGEDNLFKINYKDIPTLNSKHDFIVKEINDLKHTVEGAQKHSPAQIPVLKELINNLKAQVDEIENGVKNAKITIVKPLRGLNTIVFTIDDKHELVFKTDAQAYEPFYLVQSDNTITLHPTDKKITLES